MSCHHCMLETNWKNVNWQTKPGEVVQDAQTLT